MDALRLESASLFNVEKLKAKAELRRAEREAAGISDRVEAAQQHNAPPFDTRLVGKWIEICWPYREGGETKKIWARGQVKRIADGLSDKRSQRCTNFLPAGALLWAWEADAEFDEVAGEQWMVLLPSKWNKQVQYAWRFDPCELGIAPAARVRMPRTPMFEDACTDDEGSDSDVDMDA